jgi:hypothetical protein
LQPDFFLPLFPTLNEPQEWNIFPNLVYCLKNAMQQVTLNVADDQFRFFMELIGKLPFVQVENVVVPEWHVKLVNNRLDEHKSDPDSAIDWELAKRELESDL